MEKLRYASDMINAMAQGLYADAPDAWTPCKIRMADLVRPSAAIQRDFDEYKQIIMEDPRLNYVAPGTKFIAMGSTWLAVNPMNISQTDGSGVIRRCQTTWNHYDYYGNILKEPLIVETARASANDNDFQQWELIPTGYFNILCQNNAYTAQLNTNSRMILGKGAYRITGFSDFLSEFTEDDSAVRLLRFSARYEEPNDRIDDMENRIAGGKEFSWVISLDGTPTITAGNTTQITAKSVRNGSVVVSTSEYPISYVWTSSDETVATVDSTGLATGVGAGTSTITCTLEQNDSITASVSVTVEEPAQDQPSVRFLTAIPTKLNAYDSTTIRAAYFEGGEQTAKHVAFELSGAPYGAYTTESGNNGEITVFCWVGSVTPLTVTARHGNVSVSAMISLVGM